MSSINQIEIRRGTSNGTIETQVYDISAVGNVDAINVNYDDTITQLGVSNVQRAIEQLKANFQAGVDTVADACIRKGSTPVQPYTPDTISAAIDAIPTGITPTGTYTYDGTEAPSWIANVYNFANADASYVYNKGYNDGYSSSLNSYNVTRSDIPGATINANKHCNDNIQIINNTNNTVKCSINCYMIGNNQSISIDGSEVTGGNYAYNGILNLSSGKTLTFYQEKVNVTQSEYGYIYVTIIGGSSFTNNIIYNGEDTYSGAVTIS